jgi:hypothetical protein
MSPEQIRHLASVVSNAALAELGVIGYTEIEKKGWMIAGISLVVFILSQIIAVSLLGIAKKKEADISNDITLTNLQVSFTGIGKGRKENEK